MPTKKKFTDSLKRKFGSSIRPLTHEISHTTFPHEIDRVRNKLESWHNLEDLPPGKENKVKSQRELADRIEDSDVDCGEENRGREAGSRGGCVGGGERSVQMEMSPSSRIAPQRNFSEHMAHFLDKDHRDESYLDMNEMQVNMFRDIFKMYDKDGNDSIDCVELKLILEELGYECTTDEVLAVINKFDYNATGTIDFNEFLCLIGDWMSNDENQIRDAFEVFDRDGNGYLLLDQLKHALTMYGEAFTDEEAEEFFREIDVDGDGTITADEFIQYIKGVN